MVARRYPASAVARRYSASTQRSGASRGALNRFGSSFSHYNNSIFRHIFIIIQGTHRALAHLLSLRRDRLARWRWEWTPRQDFFFGGRHMEARSQVAPAVIQGSTRRSHYTLATTGDVYPTSLSCKKLPTARVPNPSCNKSPTAWYLTGTLPDILTTPELYENVYV